MITSFLILLLLSPVIFSTTMLETLFSSTELDEMGIRLENPHA